ncbi:MAG: pro-sigmaK processing inhibitor BofA family protein [Oscillospiraceae bacterium]|jgi:pro-sigmaK processing inhibitor BofA|nr:pro-sigmaK processing inhibitor BofA family protein [Oscillospiraceae bacterium]
MNTVLIVCLSGAGLAALWGLVKTKRPLVAALLTALSGVAALFAVNLLGTFLPVSLPVNWATIAAGAVLGVPGIIGVLVLQAVIGG